jgi:hypothetical protein
MKYNTISPWPLSEKSSDIHSSVKLQQAYGEKWTALFNVLCRETKLQLEVSNGETNWFTGHKQRCKPRVAWMFHKQKPPKNSTIKADNNALLFLRYMESAVSNCLKCTSHKWEALSIRPSQKQDHTLRSLYEISRILYKSGFLNAHNFISEKDNNLDVCDSF